jgi:hypothetical protein
MATVTEAEGLAELGLWQDAWDALEALSGDAWKTSEAWRVRLRCCPHLGAWNAGTEIADLLKEGHDPDRETAARFYHALALRWLGEGDRYAAGLAIKAAAKAFPYHRLAMLDDPQLSDLL